MGIMNWFKKNDNILTISLGLMSTPPSFVLDRASGQLTITTGPMKNVRLSIDKLTNFQLEQKSLMSYELHVFVDNIKTYSLDCPAVDFQKLQDCFKALKDFANKK